MDRSGYSSVLRTRGLGGELKCMIFTQGIASSTEKLWRLVAGGRLGADVEREPLRRAALAARLRCRRAAVVALRTRGAWRVVDVRRGCIDMRATPRAWCSVVQPLPSQGVRGKMAMDWRCLHGCICALQYPWAGPAGHQAAWARCCHA